MSSTIGSQFKVSLFGESHGEALGVMLEGIAPGITLDKSFIDSQLLKRKPKADISTPRVEADDYQIISGYFEDKTTGAPLVILVYNKNIKSKDYDALKHLYRPSHADFGADVKSLGFHDYRGGGSFSGRLTVALTIAGAIALQILKDHNIKISSKIIQVDDIEDIGFRSDEKLFDMQVELINKNIVPAVCPKKAEEIYQLIKEVSEAGDSIGAKMQTQVMNVDPGIGEPYFDGLDAQIGRALFSVGAIKGVEFGTGFNYLHKRGSNANDNFTLVDDVLSTETNHAGGIVGGLSNGRPIVVNTMVKPTPSIHQQQTMYDSLNNKLVKTGIDGRHDPAIFPRIGAVLDSVVAIVLVDAYSKRYGYMWQRGEKHEES